MSGREHIVAGPAAPGPKSRRQFLAWGLGVGAGVLGLGGAGAIGYEWPGHRPRSAGTPTTTTPSAAGPSAAGLSPQAPEVDPSQVNRFYTRSDLQPPRVRIVRSNAPPPAALSDSTRILLSPKGYGSAGPGQAGLMVLDANGGLRWFLPTAKPPFDLQFQRLGGQPVLTWWEGDVTNGTGQGEVVIADLSLREVGRIGEVDGLRPDLHEVYLTPQGTALMSAYHVVGCDLSAVGGPRAGYAYGSVALEVDVARGTVLHRWESLDHVPVADTYQTFYGGTKQDPFDYFHINSISTTPDGDLLISARNTSTIYKTDRSTGRVVWRLNGKRSDFKMGTGSAFHWQHHARWHDGSRLSVFDDGSSPPREPQSRGLLLKLDQRGMTCSLERAFLHPARLLAPNQGSMQVLPDASVVVGWGAEPYFSWFSPDGELLIDGRLPTNIQSYRAFVADLDLVADDRPAVVVGANPPGGSTVYTSWNGSTRVASWRVLAGPSRQALVPVATAQWSDFETAVTVSSGGPYFQVVALDGSGAEIGSSEIVTAA